MFDIYQKKNQPLFYVAIFCAVAAALGSIFFLFYLDLFGLITFVLVSIPGYVYHSILNSDHRTRKSDDE